MATATGCVLAAGSNRTNETRDVSEARGWGSARTALAPPRPPRTPPHPSIPLQATRHAELVAFDALRAADAAAGAIPRSTLAGATLIVTCEPCIMCAAALTLLRPDAVVFGCWNDRFGGCGSVLDAAAACHGGCGLGVVGEGGDAGGEGARDSPGAPPPRSPFPQRGGVRAGAAVALLKQFYETGNPAGVEERRRRQEGAAAHVQSRRAPSPSRPQPPSRAAPS